MFFSNRVKLVHQRRHLKRDRGSRLELMRSDFAKMPLTQHDWCDGTALYWMDTVQCHGFPTVALIRSVSLLISYEGCSFLLLPSKGTFDHVDGVDFCCFVDTFNIHSNYLSDVTWVRVTCSSDKFFLQKTCTESLSILFKIRCWLSSEFRTSWGACSVILKGR